VLYDNERIGAAREDDEFLTLDVHPLAIPTSKDVPAKKPAAFTLEQRPPLRVTEQR
jgi:hypothetical protein